MAIDCWVDMKITVYSLSEILLSNKKRATDTRNNMDEPQIYYAEKKEPETKDYIMCAFIYT